MKFLSTIFLPIFLFTENCFSQDAILPVFYLNQIPPEGVLLDKNWKFQAGDDLKYAHPAYDDRDWQPINPTLDIRDSLTQIPKPGISWFRLHLSIDSNLLKEQLALVVMQPGASEIYVNGKLLRRFGIVSVDSAKQETYNPWEEPIAFPVGTDPEIILSIRYAPEPNEKYLRTFVGSAPAFTIKLNTIERSIEQYARESSRQMNSTVFRIGFFLMLVVLHFAFYLFYPLQRANLYFSLFALCIVASEITALNSTNGVNAYHSMRSIFHTQQIWSALPSVANFFLLTAFYTLFAQKKTWIYWVLVGTVVISILVTSRIRFSWIAEFIFNSVIYAELIRIAFKAVKNKTRGARIIAVGTILFLIFWIAFIFGVPYNYMNIYISPTYILGDLIYNLENLSIPMATSIYLGLDFAFTNRSLTQKLKEVEDLSEKTVTQEKEKQQILASQNEILEKQVAARTSELQHSLIELKETQSQLIQSEKMASLGELTAGIAHEIQNPLNFVNNFSEVNTELIDELNGERSKMKGERNEKLEDEIISDIKQNLEKINQHGKRADAIVKGMLQHSRTSSGVKELTDINKLTDEYLRLAYHGFRAKNPRDSANKSFNTEIKTDFDSSVGRINIIPQEIGRVILNLVNNAFYAVNEKAKLRVTSYEPFVIVNTKKSNDKVKITIRDNGNGIPQKIVDKIFQPFFTTKPTGQGTGLGLSLAYDIVKAHGGEIKVETKEGEGSEFMVFLPAYTV